MPNPQTELKYDSLYQLLVAVILSAQCTDKRVNITTPAFFKKFPNVVTLSVADVNDVYEVIKSISYPNNKSKHLVSMAQKVVADFNGEIPITRQALVSLPGVGRKTANVITSVWDNQPHLAVDTHVFRVADRIGLITNAKNPLQAERQLLRHIPKELVSQSHHWLILHGRYICQARKPKCDICGISAYCKYYTKNIAKVKK